MSVQLNKYIKYKMHYWINSFNFRYLHAYREICACKVTGLNKRNHNFSSLEAFRPLFRKDCYLLMADLINIDVVIESVGLCAFFTEDVSTCDSRKSTSLNNKGWLTVTLSWLTGTSQENRLVLLVTPELFPLWDVKMSAVRKSSAFMQLNYLLFPDASLYLQLLMILKSN